MVAAKLRMLITSRTTGYRSGSALGEQDTADKLSPVLFPNKDDTVSRTAVRDAFRILVREGLLQPGEKRGVVVSPLKDEKDDGILPTLLVIEALVARQLAIKEERSLDRLDELQEGMRRLVDIDSKEEIAEFTDLDIEFHSAIAEMVGYEETANFIRRLRNITRLQVDYRRSDAVRRQATVDEHEQILDAIKERDLKAVEIAVRNHLVTRAKHWFPHDAPLVRSLDIFEHSRGKGSE